MPTDADDAPPPHALAWFEIPVADLDRARRFWSAVLGRPLAESARGSVRQVVLPHGAGVGGALVQRLGHLPADRGTLVYLSAGPELDPALARVEPAGGRVAVPRYALGHGFGFSAVVVDTEGNRVGLHAPR